MDTTQTLQRVHKRFTEPVTRIQYTFSEGGSNAYADGEWTKSKDTIQASVRSDMSDVSEDASGTEFDSTRILYVSTDVDIELGSGDETRADEFLIEDTGRKYTADDVYNDGALLRVKCTEV